MEQLDKYDIEVKRTYGRKSTIGELTTDKVSMFTLELPWLNNARNISCVPEGVYPYEVRHSSRWKREVIWLYHVENRSAIQIHVGNTLNDTKGCLLVGTQKGRDSVGNSRVALENLIKAIPRKGQIRIYS